MTILFEYHSKSPNLFRFKPAPVTESLPVGQVGIESWQSGLKNGILKLIKYSGANQLAQH
jgi:hypothetical protein